MRYSESFTCRLPLAATPLTPCYADYCSTLIHRHYDMSLDIMPPLFITRRYCSPFSPCRHYGPLRRRCIITQDICLFFQIAGYLILHAKMLARLCYYALRHYCMPCCCRRRYVIDIIIIERCCRQQCTLLMLLPIRDMQHKMLLRLTPLRHFHAGYYATLLVWLSMLLRHWPRHG